MGVGIVVAGEFQEYGLAIEFYSIIGCFEVNWMRCMAEFLAYLVGGR